MKKVVLLSVVLLSAVSAIAQIPYFAGTVGNGKLYGYTSVKARPGINSQETYTTFQYGLGDHFATGIDLYTGPATAAGPKASALGALIRYGLPLSKWFNIGAEVTPSFNLNDSFKFSYLTSALYLNGAVTRNGRLFWCTNTWWIVSRSAAPTFSNYEYLGYTIGIKDGQSITPMVGTIHSWRFDQDADLAAGAYYTLKNWNIYLWGNDLLRDHPRVVVGIDFTY
jgi:hypothetical protein